MEGSTRPLHEVEHTSKWQQGSPERKCLGKFASACLKAKWNTALDRMVLDLHQGTVAGLDHKEMEELGTRP